MNKRKQGRPTVKIKRKNALRVNVSDAELAAFRAAASSEGRTLADWVRRTLSNA